MTFRAAIANAFSATKRTIEALPCFADSFTGPRYFTPDGKIIYLEARETRKGSGEYQLSTVETDFSTLFLPRAYEQFGYAAGVVPEIYFPHAQSMYDGKKFSKEEAKKLIDETSLDASVSNVREYNPA